MSSIGHNSLLHQRIWHFNRWEMMCDHSNLLYIISHQSVCWSLDIISSYRHCQSFLVKYLWIPPFGAPSVIHPNCKYSLKTFNNQAVTRGTHESAREDIKSCKKSWKLRKKANHEHTLLKKIDKHCETNSLVEQWVQLGKDWKSASFNTALDLCRIIHYAGHLAVKRI